MIDTEPAGTEPGSGPVAEFEVMVTAKDHIADGVVALTLRRPEGGALPGWAAGAHIDLIVDELSPGARIRQYSLCGSTEDREQWRIAVLRESNGSGTSLFVHDGLETGDRVRVRGPRNHFPLEEAPSYLFVAGGIGITPILPMIAAAERAGADWKLLYCGRRRSTMAFATDLLPFGSDRVRLHALDELGRLDLPKLEHPGSDTLVYCCGPQPLVDAVEEGAARWPVGSVHVERFTALPTGEPGSTFEVVLQDSELTLTVPPGVSILEVVESAGVTVFTSCGEGTCGTCETAVLEGTPDHRDAVLTPAERAAGDCMMICVSRALTSRLVLEL